MNKKLLQKALQICLMTLVLMLGCMTLPSTSYEAQAATAGFKTESGKTYYVTKSGEKKTGWLALNGKKYFFNSKGVMQTGWKTLSRGKYYFGKDGVMYTGWKTISKKRYYFGGSGIMRTGWQTVGGKKYYFDSKGVVKTGLTEVDGKKYYFNSKGAMQTGWMKNSEGRYRYFAPKDGVMATGWMKNSKGEYRYFNKSTGLMYNGMKKVGNYYYYFKKTDGKRWQKGFLEVTEGKTYYFRLKEGRRLHGWVTVDGKRYYMGSDGVRYENKTATISGKTYVFDSNGVATKKSDVEARTGLTVVSRNSSYVMVTDSGRSSSKQYKLHINYMSHPGVADGSLSDLDLLAAVCDAEANDQGVIGMQAVAMCLLNRTLDTYYPSSLRGVVYQMAPGIQYAVVIDGALKRRLVDGRWEQKENAYIAAQKALDMHEAYVKKGKKRKIEGFDRDDFNFKFFMMDWCYWQQPLNFSKVDKFQYKDHVFFVDWV